MGRSKIWKTHGKNVKTYKGPNDEEEEETRLYPAEIKEYNLRTSKTGPFCILEFVYIKTNFIFRYLYELDTMEETLALLEYLLITILKENIKILKEPYDGENQRLYNWLQDYENIFIYDLENDELKFKNDIIPFTEKNEHLKKALKPFNNRVHYIVATHKGTDCERFTSDTLNNNKN